MPFQQQRLFSWQDPLIFYQLHCILFIKLLYNNMYDNKIKIPQGVQDQKILFHLSPDVVFCKKKKKNVIFSAS